MALQFRDQTGGPPSYRQRGSQKSVGHQSIYGENRHLGEDYRYTGNSVPQRRRKNGIVWIIAVPLLCVLVAVVLLLSGVLSKSANPLPDASPQPIESPDSDGEDAFVKETSDIRIKAEKIIPQFRYRYLVQRLDDRMLEDFLALYQAVTNFEKECEFPNDLSKDEMRTIWTLISENCPELFQIVGDGTYYYQSTDRDGEDVVTKITSFSYLMDEDTYRQAYQQCDRVVQDVVNNAKGLSAYEAELYVYRYVTAHCVYDLSTQYCGTPYGALVEGRAKCDGTAKAVQWILEQLDMVCMCISGQPLDGGTGHQWNVVELDGIFYDLDATADLGNQGDQMFYSRFNVNDSLVRDLYPAHSGYQSGFDFPGTNSMSGSYHARNHTLVTSGADYGSILAEQASRVMQNGGGSFAIQFIDSAQMSDLFQILSSMDDTDRFLQKYGVSLGDFSFSITTLEETNTCRITFTQ